MKKIKTWFHAAWITILSSLGAYQYQKPPTLDHNPTPTELADTISHPEATPTPSATPKPEATPVVVSGAKVPQMILKEIRYATPSEEVFIRKGFEMANQVLASPCFKSKVLSFNFTERNIYDSTIQLSNQQIYDHIAEAPIQVAVEMFYGTWRQNYIYKTMGYDIGDGTAYMNRFYVKDAKTVGSLATHEGEGHGQGFHHYGTFATSVPYKWNDFIEACYKELGLTSRANALTSQVLMASLRVRFAH